MIQRHSFRRRQVVFGSRSVFAGVVAQAQMVQDPIVTVYAGHPCRYVNNGTTPQTSVCSAAFIPWATGVRGRRRSCNSRAACTRSPGKRVYL